MISATPIAWGRCLQHESYGTEETYRCAANWLQPCRTIADWGGATGYLGRFLDPSVSYQVVDGTAQCASCVVADLTTYREPSDGIALRHVLDCTPDWQSILRNALAAMRRHLVIVTFTPDAEHSAVVKMKSGWPVWHFNPDDLRREMGLLLVREEQIKTSHPERLFYLERAE
jgi:hypothetical protein